MPDLDFSIIIPSYNRPVRLAACLEALGRLEYPTERFEVIVVDDGSAPPLSASAAPFNLTVMRQENSGPAAARNAGAARARGTFLGFTDDDCAPAPDWLSKLVPALRSESACMVGGRTVNALTTNPYAEASQNLVSYLYRYFDAHPSRERFFTSNNLAVPASEFWSIGGFDTSFRQAAGEDRWLGVEWRRRSWPMRYLPDAVVMHSHDLNLRSFWRQHVTYGRAALRFRRLRARSGLRRLPPEPGTFYFGLLRYPWTVRNARPFRRSGLLVLSQVANTLGYFREWTAGRPS